MEEEDLKAVREYLREKGFLDTELALLNEQVRLSTDFHPQVPRSRSVDDPSRLLDGYNMLRTWIYGSLDPYKDELLRLLYPVFFQSFMDLVTGGHEVQARIFFHSFLKDHEKAHPEDLYDMQRILSSNSQEMVLAQSLRRRKFRVELCEYSYELLLRYLHKEKALMMLEIINEGTSFEVSAGQPSFVSVNTLDSGPLFPLNREALAEMIKTGSGSALVAATALNIFAAKISKCDDSGLTSTAILYALSYTYLPFGLISVALGVGATKNHRLLGLAASFFLAQLVYIFIVGGVHAILCRDKRVVGYIGVYVIYLFVVFYSLGIPFVWGLMSEYPKCLHSYAEDMGTIWAAIVKIPRMAYRRIFARAAQAEVKSETDLEMGMGRGNRDQEGSLSPGRSKSQ